MSTPPEPCRTCDGAGFVETAPPDSRVIHQEPCPDCGGPPPTVTRSALVQALIQEYGALLVHAEPGPRYYVLGAQDALDRVASLLGVWDLPEQAARMVAHGTNEEGR